jgi:hypothetical protein
MTSIPCDYCAAPASMFLPRRGLSSKAIEEDDGDAMCNLVTNAVRAKARR